MDRKEYNKLKFELNRRILVMMLIKPFISILFAVCIETILYFIFFNEIKNVNNIVLGIMSLIIFLIGNYKYINSFTNTKIFVSTVYMESLKYKKNVGAEYFDYIKKIVKCLSIFLTYKIPTILSLILSYVYMGFILAIF